MANQKLVIAVCRENTDRKDVNDALRCALSVKKAVSENDNWDADILFIEPRHDTGKFEALKNSIVKQAPDCVFNLFEGFSYKPLLECEFAEMLETSGLPFTGSSSLALSLCLDKEKTKNLLEKNGLPVPRGIFVDKADNTGDIKIAYPVFIKPRSEDSSIGIDECSLVRNTEEMAVSIKNKLTDHPAGLVVEEFIPGKEYNVGYLNAEGRGILGVSVTDFSKYGGYTPFMNYAAKWDTDSDEYMKIIPEVIDPSSLGHGFLEKINHMCSKVQEIFGCSGYFRIDLREREEELYILDINPNPDINEDSGFMRQVYARGGTYGQTIKTIIKNASSTRREKWIKI